MVEDVVIKNKIDRAIIKSFDYADGTNFSDKWLSAGAIKEIVRKYYLPDEKDSTVQSRIDTLFEENWQVLLSPSILKEDTSGQASTKEDTKSNAKQVSTKKINKNRIYRLNPDKKWKYVCGPLPSVIESNEISGEMRRNHTTDLKKAINAWINHFPEPKIGDPFKESEAYKMGIESCENHLLFPDLSEHLPSLNYEVCSKWVTYKVKLKKLEKEKWALLRSVENEIEKCFCGLKLSFLPNSDYGSQDYYCTFINVSTYLIILCLSGKVEYESAWYSYQSALYDTKHNTKMVEDDSILWAYKMEGEIVRVPKKERDLLIRGIDNYIAFLENIPNSELIFRGKNIVTAAKELQLERDAMINELKDALFYYSFPGDCRYLKGS